METILPTPRVLRLHSVTKKMKPKCSILRIKCSLILNISVNVLEFVNVLSGIKCYRNFYDPASRRSFCSQYTNIVKDTNRTQMHTLLKAYQELNF